MDLEQLKSLLQQMGCPHGKCQEMANQLDKRAKQLAEKKEKSYQDAMSHLLSLMRQGWAAKEKGR